MVFIRFSQDVRCKGSRPKDLYQAGVNLQAIATIRQSVTNRGGGGNKFVLKLQLSCKEK